MRVQFQRDMLELVKLYAFRTVTQDWAKPLQRLLGPQNPTWHSLSFDKNQDKNIRIEGPFSAKHAKRVKEILFFKEILLLFDK